MMCRPKHCRACLVSLCCVVLCFTTLRSTTLSPVAQKLTHGTELGLIWCTKLTKIPCIGVAMDEYYPWLDHSHSCEAATSCPITCIIPCFCQPSFICRLYIPLQVCPHFSKQFLCTIFELLSPRLPCVATVVVPGVCFVASLYSQYLQV